MLISIVSAYVGLEDVTMKFIDHLQTTVQKELHDGHDIEFILVNGNSKKIEHPFITKRIDLPGNIGFANAFNNGLKATKGQFIAILGNDVFPTQDGWLSVLIKAQIGSKAMVVAPNNSDPGIEIARKFSKGESIRFIECTMYPAICWLLPRSTIDKIGYFDERYLIGNCEDCDYMHRVNLAGGSLFFVKDVLHVHYSSSTMRNMPKDNGENYRRFFEKWGWDVDQKVFKN